MWTLPCLARHAQQASTHAAAATSTSFLSCSICQTLQKCFNYALKLSPIFILWTIVKMSVIASSLTLYFIQNSQFWSSTPLLPVKSIFSLLTNVLYSYPFWIGVVVQWQVATLAFAVLPLLLYGSSSVDKGENGQCYLHE